MFRNKESQVLDSQSIRDILKLITHESWVILDLDNTVMESLLELGSDQWFTKLIEHACHHMPENTTSAVALVITIYQAVQHHIQTQAVEPEVVNLIKALQDVGIPVLALTARDHSLIETTFRQLDEIGIDFSKNQHGHRPTVSLGNNPKNAATYHGGIIFCNGNDKGECLSAFLEKCTKHPRHVVMVDDKQKHLSHVRTAVEALQIRFDGLRYGLLDTKVKNIDMKKAHAQLIHLKDKLPSPIQDAIDKLQINSSSAAADSVIFSNFFAPDPSKKSLKRKLEESLSIEKDLPARPSSALSFCSQK